MMNRYIDKIWRKIAFWKYSTISIEVSEDEYKTIKHAAELRNMNLDQFCEMALQEKLDKMGKK